MSREEAIRRYEAAEAAEKAAANKLYEARCVLRAEELLAEQRWEDHNRADVELNLARIELQKAFGLYGFVEELVDSIHGLAASAGGTAETPSSPDSTIEGL